MNLLNCHGEEGSDVAIQLDGLKWGGSVTRLRQVTNLPYASRNDR